MHHLRYTLMNVRVAIFSRCVHSTRRLPLSVSPLVLSKTRVVQPLPGQSNPPSEQTKETCSGKSTVITGAADADITFTPAAHRRMKHLIAKHGPDHALRVSVDSGGCSGFSYKFNWVDKSDIDPAADTLFTFDDVVYVLDSDSTLQLLAGSTVDYKSSMESSSFVVTHNPKAELACSCGKSFAMKTFDG